MPGPVTLPFVFIVLGATLIVAEMFASSFGLLGVAGGLVFAIGGMMLMFDASPVSGAPLDWGFIVVLFTVAIITVLIVGILDTKRKKAAEKNESLRGALGDVISWQGATGEVLVGEAVWIAQSVGEGGFAKGDKVKVVAVDGISLIVKLSE